jgi:hypothetical protein
VAPDFAQQHLADQKLPPEKKRPYTLMIGMRSWLFAAFRELKRDADAPLPASGPGVVPMGVQRVRDGHRLG